MGQLVIHAQVDHLTGRLAALSDPTCQHPKGCRGRVISEGDESGGGFGSRLKIGGRSGLGQTHQQTASIRGGGGIEPVP